MILAQQHATCTKGPSLPSHIPDPTAKHKPRDLIIKVQPPKNLLITKPPRTVLISGIPLCLAYRAYVRTRMHAQHANTTENKTKRKYSAAYRPAAVLRLSAFPQDTHPTHSERSAIHQKTEQITKRARCTFVAPAAKAPIQVELDDAAITAAIAFLYVS